MRAILLFLISCRNEDFSNALADNKREEEFFREALSKTARVKNGNNIVEALKEQNERSHFVSKMKDQSGLPIWDKMLTFKKTKTANKGESEIGLEQYIIPLTENDKDLSSILYVTKHPDDSFTFNNVDNERLKQEVFNPQIDKDYREQLLLSFIIADNLSFAKDAVYWNIPDDLLLFIPESTVFSQRRFTISVDASENGSTSNNLLEALGYCVTYGIECDHCSEGSHITYETYCYTTQWGGGGTGGGSGGGGDGGSGGGGGGTGTENPGGNGGNDDCGGINKTFYKIVPGCDDDDGGVPPDPKCDLSKTSITSANNILKNTEVQTKMDAVLKEKINATNEFAVSVGYNTNGTYSVTPPKEGTLHEGSVPPVISGSYVADGHSHSGSYGTPSAGDFYNLILRFPNNPYLKSRFVYGSYFGDAEVYALVVYNKTLAQSFINAYPKSVNYNETTASFLQGSALGNAYSLAVGYANGGTYENNSGEDYSSSAMAMAYVLDKFNTGISLAKVDANGNLKRLNVSIETINVSGGNGTPKTGLKITKCP